MRRKLKCIWKILFSRSHYVYTDKWRVSASLSIEDATAIIRDLSQSKADAIAQQNAVNLVKELINP